MTKKTQTKYAYDKWLKLSDAEREPMQASFDRLLKIRNMGEQCAAELLLVIGTYLNGKDAE